jgi:hypothetical protein
MQRTRVVRLGTGRLRQQAANARTLMLDMSPARAPLPSFHDLFLAHYKRIRDAVESYQRPGLAVVALDSGEVAGTACLAAKPGTINTAIVGRHGICDLFLDTDPYLSLRHLALVLYPWEGGADLRYRVLDLRTPTAFSDERERRLEAVQAEGPLFLRCGEHALFCLPTGDSEGAWPDDAEQAWDCIPERVYLEDASAEPDRWVRRRLRARLPADGQDPAAEASGRRQTLVQSVRGPSRAQRKLVADGEQPFGELEVSSSAGQTLLTLGPSAAREGVLFGRYERCDTEGLPVLTDPRISRVHLLMLLVGARLFAIDAASSNGVWLGEEEVRAAELRDGQTLTLGEGLAKITWHLKFPIS